MLYVQKAEFVNPIFLFRIDGCAYLMTNLLIMFMLIQFHCEWLSTTNEQHQGFNFVCLDYNMWYMGSTSCAAKILKFVRPFWDIMHWRVKASSQLPFVNLDLSSFFNFLNHSQAKWKIAQPGKILENIKITEKKI